MPPAPDRSTGPRLVRFGAFTFDLSTGELCKHDLRLPLETQPASALALLIENRGQIVTREEICQRLWPENASSDPNDGLHTAIRKVRTALRDSSVDPRYIETLPKRGYRFIAEVEEPEPLAAPVLELPAAPLASIPPPAPRHQWRAIAAAGLLAAVGAVAWVAWPDPAPRVLRISQLTNDGALKMSELVTDGLRLYFNEGPTIFQVSQDGGATVPVASGWLLLSGSPVVDRLLVIAAGLGTETDHPLFALRLPEAQAYSLGVTGHAAAWSPDGEKLVYANGNELYLADRNGGQSRRLAALPGPSIAPVWSPGGKTVRTMVGQTGATTLWELDVPSGVARQIDLGTGNHGEIGSWMPGGGYFVFEGANGGLWARNERFRILPGRPKPALLASEPAVFSRPVPARDGAAGNAAAHKPAKIFAIGKIERNRLARFDAEANRFLPYLPDLPGDQLAYSRDASQIAWIRIADLTLWVARADGSQQRAITPPGLWAFMPRWSPDGSAIVFVGQRRGASARIYQVSLNGGVPKEFVPGDGDQANPSWSPDGAQLAFGGAAWLHRFLPGSSKIQLFDTHTRAVTAIPGSQDLWAPKWSPDGRFLSAQTLDSFRLKLYDFQTHSWSHLATAPGSIGFPVWSHDGKFLYYNVQETSKTAAAIYRIGIERRNVERVVSLEGFHSGGSLFQWFGLTPADELLVLRTDFLHEVFALDVDFGK